MPRFILVIYDQKIHFSSHYTPLYCMSHFSAAIRSIRIMGPIFGLWMGAGCFKLYVTLHGKNFSFDLQYKVS